MCIFIVLVLSIRLNLAGGFRHSVKYKGNLPCSFSRDFPSNADYSLGTITPGEFILVLLVLDRIVHI